ncbi:hypothetical protein RGQ29_002738 [Quercus rubra]|uniref:Retrotransposon gag domain-containing protein n=1 Tax=Quercus rubra TaxID=3512 RepID=A0AAN7E9P2_QUERU|nr:hypothetical protein RGQ29_002738 [Quercus rubra]
MARGSREGMHVTVDGEYECDEIARNTQLEVCCQRMEEQFEALTKQLAALAVVNQPRNHSPTLRFVEEDEVDYNVEDEMENPFAGHGRRREKPLVSYNSNRWESGFKLDIPEFKGFLQPEEFLDWVAVVEEILEFKEVPQDKRVSLVTTKFRGRATAWWQQLKQSRINQGEDWLQSNIFQTTCTMGGKVCRLVIDSGSCENVASEEAVQKLGLTTEKHLNPHKLSWLKRGNDVIVSKRCLVSFSIGLKYKDNAWCDVVVMDACHLLLGRPWQYDREVQHDGRKNTYSFMFGSTKIVLLPCKEIEPKPTSGGGKNLLAKRAFVEEMFDSGLVFVLLGK